MEKLPPLPSASSTSELAKSSAPNPKWMSRKGIMALSFGSKPIAGHSPVVSPLLQIPSEQLPAWLAMSPSLGEPWEIWVGVPKVPPCDRVRNSSLAPHRVADMTDPSPVKTSAWFPFESNASPTPVGSAAYGCELTTLLV